MVFFSVNFNIFANISWTIRDILYHQRCKFYHLHYRCTYRNSTASNTKVDF